MWADGVAEKFSIKSRQDLDTMFEDLPARERDYHKARIKSCSGVGAQWLAQTPVCHLTQLPDADMCTDIRLRLGMPTLSISICPHINAEGRACGKECDSEGRHLLTCASGGVFFRRSRQSMRSVLPACGRSGRHPRSCRRLEASRRGVAKSHARRGSGRWLLQHPRR